MTLEEAIKHSEEVADSYNNTTPDCDFAKEHRQIAEWLKELKRLREQTDVLDKIRAEIKEWYWQADKQALAKDPCVVDAMIDLFIRTIKKYRTESEDKE